MFDEIKIEWDEKKLGRLERFVKNPPRSFWASLGQIAKAGVIGNFRAGADLSTGKQWEKKKDGKRSFLTKTKQLRRVVSQSGDGFAEVGTNMVYGRIHQFGGLAGKTRRAVIPARPWLTLSDFTKRRIAVLVRRENQIAHLSD